ncbi:MAG: hypothetical protein GXX96_02465 [Planctomycetaceae bacterium]|nr:hypothetical protein [Planctomycetaceae bacterium]
MFQHLRYRCAISSLLLLALPGAAWAGDKSGVHLRFTLADPADDPAVQVSVSGKITDAKTGEGIADALVRGHVVVWRYQGPELFKQCPAEETRTDEQGKYKLQFETPLTTSGAQKGKDSVCISVSETGYETRPLWVEPNVDLDHTNFTDVDLALDPGKLLQGTAVDEDGQPIPEALVRVQNTWSGAWNYFGVLGKTYTDEKGQFEIWCSADKAVLSGEPWLRVSKQGYGAEYFWGLLAKDSMGTLTVPRGGTIRGKVVDTNGNSVSGCEVLAQDVWPNEIDETVTNEQGEYELKGVPGKTVLSRFFERKNGRKPLDALINTTVYARTDPTQNLRDVPQYTLAAQEGQTLTGPDLVTGADTSVSGRLIPSEPLSGLSGLLVRLDTSWDHMVEADGEGSFRFPMVRTGKHTLTAYLPYNLRGDRGIGRTEINVSPGKPLQDVNIQLDGLARIRVRFVDAAGSPLEGIASGATWTKSGDGFWTEGTKSDSEGTSILYLHPGDVQYVRGFDRSDRGLVAEGYEEIEPRAGQTIDNLHVVMVPAAQIEGRLLDEDDSPVTGRRLVGRLEYADGAQRRIRLDIDASGHFYIDKVVPGAARLHVETVPAKMVASTESTFEIKPGDTVNLGDLRFRELKLHTVSGKLLPSPTFSDLKGLKIRLDLAAWEPMVAADSEGRFVFRGVPEGKHRLTAYLPFNLRTDRGVGHVSIDVKDGDVKDVELPLETLATYQLRIVDQSGKPVSGIAAAAWWTANHSGVFTEGTKSDEKGEATLYLYPAQRQYLGAHDWNGDYRLKSHQEVVPKAGATVADVTVTMVLANKKE